MGTTHEIQGKTLTSREIAPGTAGSGRGLQSFRLYLKLGITSWISSSPSARHIRLSTDVRQNTHVPDADLSPEHFEVEPEPAATAKLFPTPNQLERVRAYTASLVANSEELGLLGPLEFPRIWTRHVLNSAVVAELLKPGRVADVGSGSGLPGIVLAIARPDVHLTLIEPMERRTAWLTKQVQDLGLENVDVVRARAEEVASRDAFDQVTARAVSALRTLIPITAPLLGTGGELVLMKGARVQEEIAAAEKAIAKAKLKDIEVRELGADLLSESTWVFCARR